MTQQTLNPTRDGRRLNRQLQAVFVAMLHGEWRTLQEISDATGAPQASVSARLRDLRKAKHGGWDVQREFVHNGLWRYRVVSPGLFGAKQ